MTDCFVSDSYTHERLLIDFKLTKSRLKKNLCNPLYTVHVIYLVVAVEVILQARNNSIYILHTMPVVPLPDDNILAWFKLKQIADDNLRVHLQ